MNKKARELIKLATKDKYQEKHNGKWCGFCAIGNAKSDFDEKYPEFLLPTSQLLLQSITSFKETPYDIPLIEARDYLRSLNPTMLFNSKKKLKEFMLKSIKKGTKK